LTAADLGGACRDGPGCKMIVMEGHCHIGCIKMEMWIMDDPANPVLLCRTKVDYGKTDGWMDEMGYIGGAETCIFGDPKLGFAAPVNLKPTTKIMSIQVQNSTNARYGDMALWELNSAYVTAEDLANETQTAASWNGTWATTRQARCSRRRSKLSPPKSRMAPEQSC
jgi:hypothetical protein